MEVRRRVSGSGEGGAASDDNHQKVKLATASDALPLPLYLTNTVFFTLFFSVAYFLLHRWRDKIRNSVPLHVVTFSELAAIVSLIASFIYLLGFFGIGFVQSFASSSSAASAAASSAVVDPYIRRSSNSDDPDEWLVDSVVEGSVPSYSLEARLGDCRKAAAIGLFSFSNSFSSSIQSSIDEKGDF